MPGGPIQPTRVQVDVFELQCPGDQLAKLDLVKLGDGNPSNAEVIKRLNGLGASRLLTRIDNTADLLTEASLSLGGQLPTVSDANVPASGPAVPSTNYQSVGVAMTISGSWSPDDPQQAVVRGKLEVSTIGDSAVQIASGVRLPARVRINIDRTLTARDGQATWALSNNLPASDDDKGIINAAITRLRLTRLSVPPLSEPTEEEEEQPQRAGMQIDLFELTCGGEQLAGVDLDAITTDDPADGVLLDRLSKIGDARLLNRARNLLDMSRQSSLSYSATVPLAEKAATSPGGTARPSISYHNVGFTADTIGQWRKGDGRWADARVKIAAQTVDRARIKRSSGAPREMFSSLKLNQRVGTTSGKSLWTMSSSLPNPNDRDGTTNVLLLRLKPMWLGGPAVPHAEKAPSVVPPDQSDKPQPARVHVDLFDLACTQEQLAHLDLDGMTADDPSAEIMLERLRKQGTARLLSRVDDLVDLKRGLNLSHGATVPRVMDMKIERGIARPGVSYKDAGLTAEVAGRWLSGDSPWADLNCNLKISTQLNSHVEVMSGVTLPISMSFSVRQHDVLESGKGAWLIANRLPQADDPKGMVNVEFVRLAATRVEK